MRYNIRVTLFSNRDNAGAGDDQKFRAEGAVKCYVRFKKNTSINVSKALMQCLENSSGDLWKGVFHSEKNTNKKEAYSEATDLTKGGLSIKRQAHTGHVNKSIQ